MEKQKEEENEFNPYFKKDGGLLFSPHQFFPQLSAHTQMGIHILHSSQFQHAYLHSYHTRFMFLLLELGCVEPTTIERNRDERHTCMIEREGWGVWSILRFQCLVGDGPSVPTVLQIQNSEDQAFPPVWLGSKSSVVG
jgi:hypothetical protein